MWFCGYCRRRSSLLHFGGDVRFRKKPVVVEAWQVPPKCTNKNIGDHGVLAVTLQSVAPDAGWTICDGTGKIAISTLEGVMVADNGDWIIKEPFPTGERILYPCKADIFDLTYEPVKENEPTIDSLIALVKELSEALENAYKAVTLRPEIMAHSNFRTEMIDFEWMVTARTTLDKVREAGL